MAVQEKVLKIKRVDPKGIKWMEKTFRYPRVLKAVQALKIGQALEINSADKYMISSVRSKCYKTIKGNYRIKSRVFPKLNKAFILKTVK